jgi:hypothetical protein
MNLDRAVRVQSQFKVRIADAVCTSRIMKSTSADMHNRVQTQVFDALPKGTPRHVREFLRGYYEALNELVWREMEFCYRDAAGTLFSTHRDSTHRKTEEFYSAGKGSELGKLESAHVWKGTDKPYTAWSRMDDHIAAIKAD